MTLELQLPTAEGGRRSVPVRQVSAAGGRRSTGRTAYAAVHVVADPWRSPAGNGRCHWDAEATLAFRHHVWDQGLGAAGCGALTAPELAQERLDALFRVAGVA